MRYNAKKELAEIVEKFETAAFARGEWRHADHLVVGNQYLSENDFDTALIKMREGIFKLLKSFGVDLTVVMPYHETLTVFWLKTISDFRKTKPGASDLEICNEIVANFDKDYPLKFYSRELLFSHEARAKFVAGDLK